MPHSKALHQPNTAGLRRDGCRLAFSPPPSLLTQHPSFPQCAPKPPSHLKGTTKGKNSSGVSSSTGLGVAAPPRRSALLLPPWVCGLLGDDAPGRRCCNTAAAATPEGSIPGMLLLPPPQLLPPLLLPPQLLLAPPPLLLCPLLPADSMRGTSHRLCLPTAMPAAARCWLSVS